MRSKGYITIVLLGTFAVGFAVSEMLREGSRASAAPNGIPGQLGDHHLHYEITLQTGQSTNLALQFPATDYPVSFAIRTSTGLIASGIASVNKLTGIVSFGANPFPSFNAPDFIIDDDGPQMPDCCLIVGSNYPAPVTLYVTMWY